jgi:hypothetical protein
MIGSKLLNDLGDLLGVVLTHQNKFLWLGTGE